MDEELDPTQDSTDQTEDPGQTAPPMEDLKPDPSSRFKQYLQAQMQQNQRRQSPEYLNARDEHQDRMAGMKDQANLGSLLFDSAGKFGSVAGKPTQSTYGQFAKGLSDNVDAQAAREEQNQKLDDQNQDKNSQLYKYLIQQQAQDRKDVVEKRASDAAVRSTDPNSPAAVQSRSVLQATLRQKARIAAEASDMPSSQKLLEMANEAGKDMTAPEIAAMHNQIKDLNYDDLLNMRYKKENLGAIRDQRNAARDTANTMANDKQKASLLGKLGTDLDTSRASSRSAIGTAANKLSGAERLFSFAETSPQELADAQSDPAKKAALSARLDAMTPQQKAEIVSGLMSQVTPGSQSLGQFEHLNAPTGEERMANLKQYFMNDPAGAKAGDFILKNLSSINNEYKTSKSQIDRYFNSLKAKHRNTFSTYPEDANGMMDDYVKNLAGNDEAVAKLTAPPQAPGATGSGTAQAAPGGGGKQVVKKQFSPSRNQTKVTYSDGTTEVINGGG